MVDTGLAAALIGLDPDVFRRDRTLLGPLLESFVAAELRKQTGWSEARAALHHEPVGALTPGKMLKVGVKPGDTVEPGAVLMVTEAMKMETTVKAKAD